MSEYKKVRLPFLPNTNDKYITTVSYRCRGNRIYDIPERDKHSYILYSRDYLTNDEYNYMLDPDDEGNCIVVNMICQWCGKRTIYVLKKDEKYIKELNEAAEHGYSVEIPKEIILDSFDPYFVGI